MTFAFERDDAIIEAVRCELERRREELKRATKSITVTVILNDRNAEPVRVLFRSESDTDLRKMPAATP